MKSGSTTIQACCGIRPPWARAAAILAALLLIPACGTSGSGTLTPTVAPAIPMSLSARAGNGSATLTWAPSSAATTYVLERSTLSGGPYSTVPGGADVAGTTFQDAGLTNGKTYYYVVEAVNSFGQSQKSVETSITPGIFVTLASAGTNHTLAVLADGSLWAWGGNQHGELGAGLTASLSPVGVPVSLTQVTGLSGGQDNSVALRSDGTVWTWGDNSTGLLGVGSLTPAMSNVPVLCSTPPDIVSVSAMGSFALALKSDGTVWAWGENDQGQLGVTASGTPNPMPTQVPGISNAIQISTGYRHALALLPDGTVLAWGDNSSSQLGDGTTTSRSTPQVIPNLTGIVAISASSNHGVALDSDGFVWTWGDGTEAGRPAPYSFAGVVPGLTGIRSIAAGGLYTAALRFDGTVWIWGAGPMIRIDDGTQLTPMQLLGLQNIQAIYGGNDCFLAVDSAGLLWGCGVNFLGSLGTGIGGLAPNPVQALDLTGISKISGGCNGMALRADHTLWIWGSGIQGTLGNGQSGIGVMAPYRIQVPTPPGLNSPIGMSAGYGTILALNSDGTVWGWGYNQGNSLGSAPVSGTYVSTPVSIPGLSGITQVVSGNLNGFAIGAGGAVWGWGANGWGAVGCNSGATSIATPTALPGLSGVTSLASGAGGSVAVAGGVVWAWGLNLLGGLGNGSTTTPTSSALPVKVPGMTGFTSVAAGQGFYLALKSNGTVWMWGSTPTAGVQATPIQVTGLPVITAIAAGDNHGLALATDGTVWAWGQNDWAQLGNGSFANSSSISFPPAQVPNLTGVVAIAAESDSSLVLRNDLTIWGWGYNGEGDLGIGTKRDETSPTIFTH
jgi:alpha-tubulin suppressor-like RCC1 family protein